MNDNERWPLMGQAAGSVAARIVARHAGWNLAECASYHGLPLAALLHDEARALLVGATDGALPTAIAIMDCVLTDTRSDGVIVGRPRKPHGLPELALGLWRQGNVAWHQPLLPWLSAKGTLWLVRGLEAPQSTGFELTIRRIGNDPSPWPTEDERQAGLTRASEAFASVHEEGG